MADGFNEDQPGSPEPDVEASERSAGRLGQTFAGRPLMVYLVLFAGAGTLLALLAVVWMSATGGGSDERPICTSITAAEARDAILGGKVDRINVLVDRDRPLQSLTGLVLELADGTCRQSDQGADFRNDLYMILGVTEHYNNFADRKVRIHYQQQQIQSDLLMTSTPTPTATSEATATLEPTATVEPSPTAPPPTPEPSPTATETLAPSPTAPATDSGQPSVIAAPTLEVATVTPTQTAAP
jgi:hypothetical protein